VAFVPGQVGPSPAKKGGKGIDYGGAKEKIKIDLGNTKIKIDLGNYSKKDLYKVYGRAVEGGIVRRCAGRMRRV
jgi:hypothetical protein